MMILHDPRLEPGFELPTDHRWGLCFGQKGGMTDTVEAFGNVDLEHILRSKLDAVKNGFDRVPTGASWTKAIGLRRQLGFPCGFQGLTHDRLLCPVILGRHPERALFRGCPTLRNPGAPQWCGLAIAMHGLSKGQAF